MAKSKSFFTLRKGSTKSLTLSTLHGLQITKDRVHTNSSSNSDDAISARARLTLVSQCRSRLRRILDHSFEGIPYGNKSLQEFSRVNLTKPYPAVYQWPPKSSDDIGSASLQISNGRLQELQLVRDPFYFVNQHQRYIYKEAEFKPAKVFGSVPSNKYFVIPKEEYDRAGNLNDFLNINNLGMAMISYLLNINQEEQLTAIFQNHCGNTSQTIAGRTLTFPLTNYKYTRVSPSLPNNLISISNIDVNDTSDGEMVFLQPTSGIVFSSRVTISTLTNSSNEYYIIHPSTNPSFYAVGTLVGGTSGQLPEPLLYGLIASRKDGNGIWRRSPCKLRKFDYSAEVVNKSNTLASYYNTNGKLSGDNQFLNNGDGDTGINGNSGHNIQSNLPLADNFIKDDSGSDNGNK